VAKVRDIAVVAGCFGARRNFNGGLVAEPLDEAEASANAGRPWMKGMSISPDSAPSFRSADGHVNAALTIAARLAVEAG
jgi:hypothetical protein